MCVNCTLPNGKEMPLSELWRAVQFCVVDFSAILFRWLQCNYVHLIAVQCPVDTCRVWDLKMTSVSSAWPALASSARNSPTPCTLTSGPSLPPSLPASFPPSQHLVQSGESGVEGGQVLPAGRGVRNPGRDDDLRWRRRDHIGRWREAVEMLFEVTQVGKGSKHSLKKQHILVLSKKDKLAFNNIKLLLFHST